MTVSPDQIWWTVNELADARLPDLPKTRQSVARWVERTGARADPAKARRRSGRGGGFEYHWTVLPLAARKALLAKAAPKDAPNAFERGEAWEWFEGLPEAAQEKARHMLACIQAVETLEAEQARDLAVRAVAQAQGIGARTLWGWLARVEGVRADDRLPALAPRHRTAKRKVETADFDEEFFDWIKADYLRPAAPSFASVYRRALRTAAKKGWKPATERTMRRYLDARVSEPVQVLARKGVDALKRMYPAQVRDKTALHALECVNGDFHRFDVWVSWPGQDKPVRPQMVAFQDVYSGRILSWRLDLTPNSHAVMLAAGDMINDWGIPEHVLLDNGREFAAKSITGGAKTRFRFKVLEEDIPGLFVSLGCEIHWATPYAGQSKPIERAFRDMCDAIAKDPRFDGAWTGNRPDAQPEDYGSRAVPFEQFLAVVAEGIEEHNMRQGRRSEVAWGRSFAEVFDESYSTAPIRKATDAQRRLWLMGAKGLRADTRTGRVKLMGNEYWSEWMHEIMGQRVVVRFDPADLHAPAHIYSIDNRYLGEAECRLQAGFLSVEDARAHNQARKSWMKAEKAALKAHRKLTARELGVELDAISPTGNGIVKPDAKVVRPIFTPAPKPAVREEIDPEIAVKQAAIIADFAARKEQQSDDETARERFKRAIELERVIDAGGEFTAEQHRRLTVYQNTPEYKAEHALWQDFGDAYFG